MWSSAPSVTMDSLEREDGTQNHSFRKAPHDVKKARPDDTAHNPPVEMNAAAAATIHQLATQFTFSSTAQGDRRASAVAAGNGGNVVAMNEITNPHNHPNPQSTAGGPKGSGTEGDFGNEADLEDVDLHKKANETKEWDDFCQNIREREPPNSVSRRTLGELTNAGGLRIESQMNLEDTYARSEQSLMQVLEAALTLVKSEAEQESLAPKAQSQELTKLVKDNHRRRQEFVDFLHDQYRRMEVTYMQLLSGVLNEAPTVSMDSAAGAQDKVAQERSDQEHENESDRSVNVKVGKVDEHGGTKSGPSWEDLLQFAPMRESTELLMVAQEDLEQADAKLNVTLETLSFTLRDALDQLGIVSSDAYQSFSANLEAQEGEIQLLMMRNLERRQNFEAAVREQAEQSKNFFQQFMYSIRTVVNSASCHKRSSPDNDN